MMGIKEQYITVAEYLKNIRKGSIDDNGSMRRAFCWDNRTLNEFIISIMEDAYIPPIILAPVIEADSAVIVDGIQRSAAMMLFRYGNYRITSVVEKPVIERDDIALDMRGAAYDELPLQFRRIFDSYKLRVVTITGSNIDTGRLIRIYNRHSKLNITQHGLTYLGQYAEGVRVAAMSGFFRNCMEYSDDERRKGLYERIVCEAVAWLFHREYAELNFTNMCDRLREHMSYDELAEVQYYLDCMERIGGDDFKGVLTADSVVMWLRIYRHCVRSSRTEEDFYKLISYMNGNDHMYSVMKKDLRNGKPVGKFIDKLVEAY